MALLWRPSFGRGRVGRERPRGSGAPSASRPRAREGAPICGSTSRRRATSSAACWAVTRVASTSSAPRRLSRRRACVPRPLRVDARSGAVLIHRARSSMGERRAAKPPRREESPQGRTIGRCLAFPSRVSRRMALRDTHPSRDSRRVACRDPRPSRKARRPSRDSSRVACRDTRPSRKARRPSRDSSRVACRDTRPSRKARPPSRDSSRVACRDTRPSRKARHLIQDSTPLIWNSTPLIWNSTPLIWNSTPPSRMRPVIRAAPRRFEAQCGVEQGDG